MIRFESIQRQAEYEGLVRGGPSWGLGNQEEDGVISETSACTQMVASRSNGAGYQASDRHSDVIFLKGAL